MRAVRFRCTRRPILPYLTTTSRTSTRELPSLTILNTSMCAQQPTYCNDNRKSTIDLVIASHPLAFSTLAPMHDLELSSDHFPMLLTSTPASSAPPAARPSYSRWCTEKADWDLFKHLQTFRGDDFLYSFDRTAGDTTKPQTTIETMWSNAYYIYLRQR